MYKDIPLSILATKSDLVNQMRFICQKKIKFYNSNKNQKCDVDPIYSQQKREKVGKITPQKPELFI